MSKPFFIDICLDNDFKYLSIEVLTHITKFDLEIKSFGELFEMEDKKEGIEAFLNKRKPQF